MHMTASTRPAKHNDDHAKVLPGTKGAHLTESTDPSSVLRVLDVRVDTVQIPDVIRVMERWIEAREVCRGIAVTGMHGVTEARHNPSFKKILDAADLIVPDGMPLVWLGRLKGHPLERRVYGPELMYAFCEQTARKGYRHYFYGGAPGVPERLEKRFLEEFPQMVVAGTHSPPFRPLTPQEDEGVVEAINRAHPDVLWVGLGTPKQEIWIDAHRNRLRVPVIVAVGAAFDINAGTKRQAPCWMREHGLEWSFRLVQEPRRLWRRYLVYGTKFVFYVGCELWNERRASRRTQGT